MDVYAENILEHYRNPQNKGKLENATVSHEEKNTSCGDELIVHLLIEDGVLKDLKWDGVGCAISQAAISILSDEIIGMKVEDISAKQYEDIEELLGVPISARRVQCAVLGLKAVQEALASL